MPQDKQCEKCTKYWEDGQPLRCKSICNCICHTPTSPKTWRENIHKELLAVNVMWRNTKIPLYIVNAIDAAYTAGLDDREEAFKAGEALGQQNGMRMVVEDLAYEMEDNKHSIPEIFELIRKKYNL